MPYQAVSDRIIILPEKAADKIGNVAVPDSSKGKSKMGIVISVGPDCKEAKSGYEVMILEGHGALFIENGIDKLVVKESDVLCMSRYEHTPITSRTFIETYFPGFIFEINGEGKKQDEYSVYHKSETKKEGCTMAHSKDMPFTLADLICLAELAVKNFKPK